jgi:hypothetical protein
MSPRWGSKTLIVHLTYQNVAPMGLGTSIEHLNYQTIAPMGLKDIKRMNAL